MAYFFLKCDVYYKYHLLYQRIKSISISLLSLKHTIGRDFVVSRLSVASYTVGTVVSDAVCRIFVKRPSSQGYVRDFLLIVCTYGCNGQTQHKSRLSYASDNMFQALLLIIGQFLNELCKNCKRSRLGSCKV